MSNIGPKIPLDNLICWFDPIESGFEEKGTKSDIWYNISLNQKTSSSNYREQHFSVARKRILRDQPRESYLSGLTYHPLFKAYDEDDYEGITITVVDDDSNISSKSNLIAKRYKKEKIGKQYEKKYPGTFISMFDKSRNNLITNSGNFSITTTINIDRPQYVLSNNFYLIRKKQSVIALLEENYKHNTPGEQIVIGIKSPYYKTSTTANYKSVFSPFSFFVNISKEILTWQNPYGLNTDVTHSFTIQTDYKFEFKTTYMITFVYSNSNTLELYINGERQKIAMTSGKGAYRHGFRKNRGNVIMNDYSSHQKDNQILQPGFKNWNNNTVTSSFSHTLPSSNTFNYKLFRLIPYDMGSFNSYLYNPFVTLGNSYLHNINLNQEEIINIYNTIKNRF